MTGIADLTGDDDWLSAAEALRRVEAVMGEFRAKLAIAARAHGGLARTRADRFIKQGDNFDDAELPKEFWWAEGHEALEQNWASGDFSTWINHTWEWKAYGVRFHRDDIAKLIPLKPEPSASEVSTTVDDEREWVSARDAVYRIMGATRLDATKSLYSIIAYAKAGDV